MTENEAVEVIFHRYLLEALTKEAEEHGITVAELIRAIVKGWVATKILIE